MSDDRWAAHEARLTAQDEHGSAVDARATGQDVRADGQDARADHREVMDAERWTAQDARSDWQDRINADHRKTFSHRLRSLAVGVGVGLLALAIALPFLSRSAHRANKAADAADRAAACSNLLLGSVSAQTVDPRALELHCDTRVAADLIARGVARDQGIQQAQAQAQQAQAQIVMAACALLPLLPVPQDNPRIVTFRATFGCA